MEASPKARRRRMLLPTMAAMVTLLVLDVALGWPGVGRYFVGLVSRAGPTRDAIRAVRAAAGGGGQRPIVLRVWDWWSPSTTEDYAAYFSELESIFESRNPDVDVIFQAVPFANYEQKLATGMLGRNPPDVFQCSVDWAQGFYRRGVLRRLNDLIAATEALQDDKFIKSSLYHTRMGDDIFGIAHIMDGRCLLWNLEMLRAKPELHGMFEKGPDGKADLTRLRYDAVDDWEHFREIAKLLSNGRREEGKDPNPAGFEINAYGMEAGSFMPWASANGVKFQNRQGTKALFATPASAQALEFLLQLYHEDGVCPTFRRGLTSRERFQKKQVACIMGGTWDGKYIVRDTQGWKDFGMTAFPPGPAGAGPKTSTWGNMIVMSSRCKVPEAAWKYMQLVCGTEGALLKLKYLKQNSPRVDFYQRPEWKQAIKDRPFLANVPKICAVGDPLHHTQVQAVRDEVQPIFEYLMLNWDDVKAGKGRFKNVQEAIDLAGERVDQVYARYARVVKDWDARKNISPAKGDN